MKQHLQFKLSKTSLFFILSFFYFTTTVFSQNFVWARTFGGVTYDDWRATAIDASGNVIAIGSFSGTVDFDPGVGVFNMTSVAGGDDIFVMKLTSAGALVWAKKVGAATDETASDVIVDAASNIYVVGQYRGTVDFDPGVGTTNLVSAGNTDCFMWKLNSAGTFVWAKSMGGVFGDWASSITMDAANTALYVTGTFTGTADFNPGAATNTLTVHGSQDAFVGKYDLNGNYVWAVSLGGASTDYGSDVAVNAAGTIVYCTGIFYGSNVNLTPGCACATYTSAGQGDVYVVKLVTSSGGYNSLGVIGGNSYDNNSQILLDASDNVYLSGQFSTLCDFDPGFGINTLASMGSSDGYVCKWSPTLVYQWSKQIGGLNTQSCPGMALDPLGNIYVTGSFDDIVDFDPSATSSYTMQANGLNQDCFILKWDNNTNFIWAKSFGSNNIGDSPSDLDLDAQGNVYTIGSFWSTVDFDPGPGSYSLTAVGQTDGYIHKLSCTLPTTISTTSSNFTICAGTPTTIPVALTGSLVQAGTNYGWSVSGASGVGFSPSTATNTSMSFTGTTSFSIIITATNACGTTTSQVNTVFVNPKPTIVGIATPTAVCSGSLLTLSGSGANTYTWSSGVANTVPFTPTASATYTVMGTALTSCTNSATISVNQAPNPTVTVSGKNVICLNKPQTLTGAGASTYTWFPGSIVGSTITATPTVTTVYTINATSLNGCNGGGSFTVNIVQPPIPNICQVTTDSLGFNNEIYWDKTLYPSADSFIVYRETSLNNYKRIAALHKSVYSMYVDTNRSIGPANGNPNLTYYKYKMQIRDTCGNLSAMSKWHETIFIQDQLNGNFNWNSYGIELSAPPITLYNVKRRMVSTGTETLIVSTVGNLANDPFYASFWPLNVKWFVDAVGFSCNATAKVMVLKTKTKSNQSNDKLAMGITNYALANNVHIYPNPASDLLNIDLNGLSKTETNIEILNTLGQIVYETKSLNQHLVINTSELAGGVYIVNIKQNNNVIAVKKVVIDK
ncbi:MAG: T9SS type A sorting domain-containing protein [Bacteroidia bacterium]|nr:T9SS type A sorting domain-containing protein [Bacteroidia bacterium]